MLLFTEGCFFQVLEGDESTVERVYARISSDPRHRDVTLIIRERIAERDFGEWSMGFVVADREGVSDLVGSNDFFTEGDCLAALDQGRAKKLLQAFRKGRWRGPLAAAS